MFERYDVISIGDMSMNVFLALEKQELEIRHDKKQQKVCFNYADKIPVESMHKTIGGNASNVAVGIRRLGLKSALVTTIGHDDEGRAAQHELIKEKVDTRFVKHDKRTNFSAVLNYGAERSIFVYHESRDYTLPRLPKARFVYLTSMKSGWEAIIKPLAEYLDKSGAKLAFNPGTYQLRAGSKVADALLDRCEVIFLNVQEALLYANKPTGTPIKELLAAVHRKGPRTVVITDGPGGSYASDSTGQYFLGIYNAPVVERTGCGDAYGSGFTAALCKGKDLLEAMRWGSFEAASVLGEIGPQAGLLKPDEFAALEKKYPNFHAKEIEPKKK